MNKIKITLLVAICILFTACNKDDAPNNKRPVKIEAKFSDGYSFTNDITYNGNLLKSYKLIGEGTANANITYNTANKITKLLLANENWNSTTEYQYNSKGDLEIVNSSNNETKFTYHADGTINQVIAKYFDRDGNERDSNTYTFAYENGLIKSIAFVDFETGHYKQTFNYDANNNLIAVIQQSQSSDGITFGRTKSYKISYDDSINPAYKILNDSNLLNTSGVSLYSLYNGHNGLKVAYEFDLGNGHNISFYSKNNYITNDNNQYITSYNYTYDAGYPIKLVEVGSSNYEIEYNFTYEEY